MKRGPARRTPRRALAAPLRRRHYRAFARGLRCYRSPARDLWRYASGRGSYPYRCRIRACGGQIALVLEGPDDMVTVHEVFCGRAYPVNREATVVVDIGANIGISALFFLTEAPRCRVHLFEPNPALIARLRSNLSAFAERIAVNELAVATHGGSTQFGVEPTGRYGGIVVMARAETIQVPCRPVAEVIEEVLEEEQRIDLLKVDTEGTELELLRSLPAHLVERIEAIHVETAFAGHPLPGAYSMHREGSITRLSKPGLAAPAGLS